MGAVRELPGLGSQVKRLGNDGASGNQELALEVTLLREREMLGVRHARNGQRIRIRDLKEFQDSLPILGQGRVLAEVRHGEYVVHVPPKWRAHLHECAGLARLITGPETLLLAPGDWAIVSMGRARVRVQIGLIDRQTPSFSAGDVLRWVLLAAALYVTALIICSALALSTEANGSIETKPPSGSVAP